MPKILSHFSFNSVNQCLKSLQSPPLLFLQQSHGGGSNSLAGTDLTKTFVGLGLDVHRRKVNRQKTGYAPSDLSLVRFEPRLFSVYRHIDVDNLPVLLFELVSDGKQQLLTVNVFPLFISIRK